MGCGENWHLLVELLAEVKSFISFYMMEDWPLTGK